MSRAVRDLETLRACHTARMRPASIAHTLGRSLKWVEARIAEIEAESESLSPPAGGRPPAQPAEEGPRTDATRPPQAPSAPAFPQEGERGCARTLERLGAVRKASRLGLDLDDIAALVDAPRAEVERVLGVLLGRTLDEAALELAKAVPCEIRAQSPERPVDPSNPVIPETAKPLSGTVADEPPHRDDPGSAPSPSASAPAGMTGSKKPLSGLVPKSVYAAHRGVSQSAISHFITRGRLHGAALVRREKRVQIDVAIADAQLGEPVLKKAAPQSTSVEAAPADRPSPRTDGPGSGPITQPRPQPPAYYNVAPRLPRGRSTPNPTRLAPPPPPPMKALKPVTTDVARWTWWFVASGWELDEVADLFDRDPAELGLAAIRWNAERAPA